MNWKAKALAATASTKLGAIIAAVLGEQVTGPHFVGHACVTVDDMVLCNFKDENGLAHFGTIVCELPDLVRNISLLADHLTLTADERNEFATAVCAWIIRDYSNKAKTLLAREIRARSIVVV